MADDSLEAEASFSELDAAGLDLPADSVVLPSRGILYGPDDFFHMKKSVEFRPMTPRQEDILINPAYRKAGTTIEKLVASSLMKRGVDISKLLTGDRDALMIAIRISGYGSIYPPIIECPSCEEVNNLAINLGSIVVKNLDLKPKYPGENLFEFVLPKSKHKILFKFLTVEEERRLYAEANNTDKFDYSPVTTKLNYSIVMVNGVANRKKIRKFISKMPALDSRCLTAFIDKNQPGLDMNVTFSCENCPHTNLIKIPTDYSFFSLESIHREAVILEPFFLLGYYFGMNWKTYYNLPVQYKKWLIGIINKVPECSDTWELEDFKSSIEPTIELEDICKCGHHTKDHSHIPNSLYNNLECDICECENFSKISKKKVVE